MQREDPASTALPSTCTPTPASSTPLSGTCPCYGAHTALGTTAGSGEGHPSRRGHGHTPNYPEDSTPPVLLSRAQWEDPAETVVLRASSSHPQDTQGQGCGQGWAREASHPEGLPPPCPPQHDPLRTPAPQRPPHCPPPSADFVISTTLREFSLLPLDSSDANLSP